VTASAAVGAAGVDAADATAAEATAGAPALVEARSQALLIAAVRLALGVAGVGASIARGVHGGPAIGLFVVGAAFLLLAVYGGDRRQRSALKFKNPDPAPPEARVEGWARSLALAAYPSTIGLTALTGFALWRQPGLAALLAGILGGLAVMSLIGVARLASWERERGVRIFVEAKTNRAFETPR
jgi:hypothetical protein